MAKVKVFEKKVNFQGHKVKNYGTCEKSCHKEYTCETWKPYLF